MGKRRKRMVGEVWRYKSWIEEGFSSFLRSRWFGRLDVTAAVAERGGGGGGDIGSRKWKKRKGAFTTEKDSLFSLLLQALGFYSVFYHAFNLLHLFPSSPLYRSCVWMCIYVGGEKGERSARGLFSNPIIAAPRGETGRERGSRKKREGIRREG